MQTESAYNAPPFEEADALCSEILDFLLDCGGVYKEVTAHLQEVVLTSIATGQYVIYRDPQGSISHWLAYWKILPYDIEDIEEIKPINITLGTVLYIAEHGNKDGRHGMTMIIKELRRRSKGMQGVLWNSKGRGIKTFMHQKGE